MFDFVSPAPAKETIRSVNWLRLGVGLTLLGLVIVAWSPFVINHATTLAVVNAEILRITSPIQGVAAADLPAPGARLAGGAEISLVETTIPEERELDRQETELAMTSVRIKQLEEALATIERHEADVRDRWAALVATGQEILSRQRDEADAKLRAALARHRQAEAELLLAEDMRRRGLYSDTRVEAARSAVAAASAEADAAQARIATLEAKMRALARGVHFTDGYNDVPYNVQQLDRLLLIREDLKERLSAERARETGLLRSLARERRAAELRANFTRRIDRPLMVWARHVAPGALVGPGTMLLDLVDCERLFVDALLPDRAYPDLFGARRAQIRLAGGIVLSGDIVEVRGAGARERGIPTAARPEGDAIDRLTLRITLSAEQANLLRGQGDDLCGIGRHAEVIIPGRLPRFFSDLRDALRRLSPIEGIAPASQGSASAQVPS